MAAPPDSAPSGAWEVRVRWGSRRLSAEVLDARGRAELSLGDRPEDDFATGSPARLRFTWRDGHLDVRFSAGVTGSAALRGDAAVSLSQLAQRGAVTEGSDGFTLTLSGADTATLTVGALKVEARQVTQRLSRIPFDVGTLLALLLAIAALALLVGSVLAPSEGPQLQWLRRP